LDEELLAIDPRLVEMRAGIGDALASDGPDLAKARLRLCLELVSQALRNSVADEEVKATTWYGAEPRQ
jgi:hypothetical protein